MCNQSLNPNWAVPGPALQLHLPGSKQCIINLSLVFHGLRWCVHPDNYMTMVFVMEMEKRLFTFPFFQKGCRFSKGPSVDSRFRPSQRNISVQWRSDSLIHQAKWSLQHLTETRYIWRSQNHHSALDKLLWTLMDGWMDGLTHYKG